MRRIPDKLRKEMSNDPYYESCCVGDVNCDGSIEWHHAIIYKGRQLNEKWAIVPACEEHHNHSNQWFIRYLRLQALNRATKEELIAISKAKDWTKIREHLRKIYAPYKNDDLPYSESII